MSDLISRSALIEALEYHCEDSCKPNTIGGIVTGTVRDCIKIVGKQPTIEAVPVVERDKIIDEFYDEVLNFEDYIEPITDDNGILLYSGCDITDMIVKIKKKFERSKHEKTD